MAEKSKLVNKTIKKTPLNFKAHTASDNLNFINNLTNGSLDVSLPEQSSYITIKDERKLSPTTGKPVPKSDSTIKANKELIEAIIAHAKANNIDPKVALAIAYQETKIGITDDNIGHNLLRPSQQWLDNEESGVYKKRVDRDASQLIDGIKQKFDYANQLGKKTLVDSIQTYNGLGKLYPSTEASYHGGNSKAFYGIPVTKDNPIDLNKNPVYGKSIKSIGDSIIGVNPEIQSLIKDIKPFEMKKQNYIKKYAIGEEMTPDSIVSGVGNSLDTLGQFIPTDNDGYGVSKKGQAISTGIQSGLGAAADVAGNFGPMGKMVSGALKIGQFLTKGFTAIADAVKEKRNPTDELVNETYSPTYKDSSMSFGSLNTLNQRALGGQTQSTTDNFKQYEAPSHENGGQMIDANNNPTKQPQKAVAEIEKKENSYKNYVFSHELGFAKLAEKINKKYKDREDPISKNSLDTELTELMKKNEKVKQQIQQSQQLAQAVLEYGGKIPKASLGVLLSDKNKLPYEKGYVNQLMENAPDNNGVSVPVPNVDFLKGIASSKDILQNNFNLKEAPEPPNNDEKNPPKTEAFKKQFSPEAISGFGIKGIEMLGHAIQAFKKPDYVKPAYNPEENAIKGTMANRKVDNQVILDAINLEENAGKQNLADNSSSVGVQQANLQKLHANTTNAIAKTKIEEQQLNNQYRGEEANMLNTLGTQKMQAQVYAEDANAKSKANVQMQRDKFLKESIGGLGDYLLKKDAVNKENNFQMNVLKQKGINFTVNDDWKSFSKAGIDIVKFDAELESETDKEKRKALIEKNAEKLKPYITKEGYDNFLTGYTNKFIK